MTEANQPSEPNDSRSDALHCCVRQPLTFGSLFAGIGGIDLGFERAGMQCKWQVEIDEYARKVLAKHWPEVRRHDDVKTWPTNDAEPVDIIAGGFPCQDISNAGHGEGITGSRSGLFFEAMRVVRKLRPRYVVLENVPALLARGMGAVCGELAASGYDAEWDCIPAAAVGAPHRRDRIFVVAIANGHYGQASGAKGVQARSADRLGTTGQQSRVMADTAGTRRKARRGDGNADSPSSHRRRASEPSRASFSSDANGEGLAKRQSERSDDGKEQSPIVGAHWWQLEPDVGRVANGVPRRVDRLRGLGNAVVPQVAEWIGRRIVEAENHVT